jgi:membrane protease YdiL (CAAX protease family)
MVGAPEPRSSVPLDTEHAVPREVGVVEAVTPVRPAAFFALTYLLSWLIWVPLVASHFEIGPITIPEGTSNLVRLFGVLMPAAVALFLTARLEGRAGVGRLLGRLRIWRVGWQWWMAAVAVPSVILVAIGGVWSWAGASPSIEVVDVLSAGALAVNIVFLLLASRGEEIGWRGVALPGLEQRSPALRASIVLGLLWSTWHLPFWLLQDSFDQFGVGYLVLDFLLIVPSTIYITWFFNHTRFSLLLPVAFHVVFNTVNVAWLPVTGVIVPFAIYILSMWAISALVARRLDVPPLPTPRPSIS